MILNISNWPQLSETKQGQDTRHVARKQDKMEIKSLSTISNFLWLSYKAKSLFRTPNFDQRLWNGHATGAHVQISLIKYY